MRGYTQTYKKINGEEVGVKETLKKLINRRITMKRVSKKEFSNSIKNKDIMFLGASSKLSVKEMLKIIEEKLPKFPLNYNRIVYKIGSVNIKFLIKKEDKIEKSTLNIIKCDIYKKDNIYIIDDIENNIRIGYLISNNYTLSNLEKEYLKQKEKEILKKEEEKKQKDSQKQIEKEKMKYFDHKNWNKEKVKKLIPLQFGRVKKVLEELYKFEDGIMKLKKRIEKDDVIKKYKMNFSKKKYNILYLKNDKEYYINIPKIVYDLLKLEEEIN